MVQCPDPLPSLRQYGMTLKNLRDGSPLECPFCFLTFSRGKLSSVLLFLSTPVLAGGSRCPFFKTFSLPTQPFRPFLGFKIRQSPFQPQSSAFFLYFGFGFRPHLSRRTLLLILCSFSLRSTRHSFLLKALC